jgi:hypothetical protein
LVEVMHRDRKTGWTVRRRTGGAVAVSELLADGFRAELVEA